MTTVTNRIFGTLRAAGSVRPAVLMALLATVVLAAMPAQAVVYDFLLVTTNATSGTFTSTNGNGFITTTTGANNPTNALYPGHNSVYLSTFTNLFLASGTVQGWVTRYENGSTYTNTFNLSNYTLSSNTIFGIWNITAEYEGTYCIQLFAGNTQIAPVFTWNFFGYDDNSYPPDVNVAHHHMVLNTTSGCFSTTNYPSSGSTDCDGAFWNKIPTNTTKIVIKGVLGPAGRDGVGFYFAEPKPPCAIICPSNIIITTLCGAPTNVSYPPPIVFGDCGTNTSVSCDPASGSSFGLGTNLVHCTVPGLTNLSCDFSVIVLSSDPVPPVISCPSNIVVFTCGSNVVVNYSVTATDNVATVTTNCLPPSGTAFPVGTNTVVCTATDACSNLATCQFDVIVKLLPPVWGVSCPSESLLVNVTGCPPVMPNLTNLVTITNQCPIPGGLTTTQIPAAGTVLSIGTNAVTITVCATNGTCQSCVFNVNASLSAGCCTMACPTNLTVTTCGTNAVVNYPTPIVSGPCVSNVTVVCSPPSGALFSLGTNTVNCIATNGAGTTVVSCSFTVTVTASVLSNAYDFLSVSITGLGGKFASLNGNGFITVTNTGGPFLGLNNTVWPSQFTNLFLASGTVTGWLAQADNFAIYTNTFYLTNYTLSSNTVFGMWSITEETNAYSIKLLDAANNPIAPPFTWNFIGYDDDALHGNIAWKHMNLNDATGFFSPTNYKASGIDCDGAFWDNIPLTTRKIVVTGTLGAANADGVVFYFAERRRCPIIPCPLCPVILTATLAGTDIVLSWRQDALDYGLEETPELVGPLATWTPVTNSPTTSGGEYHVTLPAPHPRRFYRLSK